MIRNHRPTTRAAFTLVEMMVSMALAIGIMWMLAESFKMGLDFTSKMRSTGQQSTLLNGAGMVLTRDLQAEHFLPDDNKPNRGVRLSDQYLHQVSTNSSVWRPPTGGFFRIISPAGTIIGTEDSFSVGTATNHALHFTSILKPGDQNPYTAAGTNAESRAAEIAYFLVDSGQWTSNDPLTRRPLYHLIRRQRLVAMTNDDKAALVAALPADPNAPADVIAHPVPNPPPPLPTKTVYSLEDLTNPTNRLQVSPLSGLPGATGSPLTFGIGTTHYGEDILLSNVLSFEVLVDWTQNMTPPATDPNMAASRQAPRTFAQSNFEYPFDNLSVNTGHNQQFATAPLNGVFDTWYPVGDGTLTAWNNFANTNTAPNNKLPLAIRVKALQITIRIFDPKTKQSRQNTWKFSM